MKKLLSLIISVVVAISITSVAATAFAADVNSPTATTAASGKISLLVNNKPSKDITYSIEKETVSFTYTGTGNVVDWTSNLEDELGFVEGVDFNWSFNDDGSLTIEFISSEAINAFYNDEVTVNAVVEYDIEEATEATTENEAKEKDDTSKSPETGIATSVIAGSVALAGAGLAVLSAKKRDAE